MGERHHQSIISKKSQFLLSRSLTYHSSPSKSSNTYKTLLLYKHITDDTPNPKRITSPTSKTCILYTTSLRTIRRTHSDCCAVRNILRGFRILIDERDVSMDSAYRRELQSILNNHVSLPQLFVNGILIGGADEVRRLDENGELGKLLEGVRRQEPGFVCRGCGGVRFVPCGECSGSRKLFLEEEGRMRRCEECNENGLVRCSNCCLVF